MMLDDLETLSTNLNLQYLHTLLHGEAICQFDTLYAQVGSKSTAHLNRVILNILSKHKFAMRRVMRKPR